LEENIMALVIDFNQVNTDEEWVNALASIIDAGISANTLQQRSDLILLLGRFVQRSPTRLSALDDIAMALQTDLALTNTAARISRIEGRNNRLRQLAGQLGVEVLIANSDAGRLTRIKAEIDKATATVTAIKQLADGLNSSGSTSARFQAVFDSLDKLAQALGAQN
jgi:hypothetical protein